MRKLNRATTSLHKHVVRNINKVDGALPLADIRVPKAKLPKAKNALAILAMATQPLGTSYQAVEKKLGVNKAGIDRVLGSLKKRNGLIVTLMGKDATKFRVKVPRNSTAKWREYSAKAES